MKFPDENQALLKSLAKCRDDRRWWQKLDDLIERNSLWPAIILIITGSIVVLHHAVTFP